MKKLNQLIEELQYQAGIIESGDSKFLTGAFNKKDIDKFLDYEYNAKLIRVLNVRNGVKLQYDLSKYYIERELYYDPSSPWSQVNHEVNLDGYMIEVFIREEKGHIVASSNIYSSHISDNRHLVMDTDDCSSFAELKKWTIESMERVVDIFWEEWEDENSDKIDRIVQRKKGYSDYEIRKRNL